MDSMVLFFIASGIVLFFIFLYFVPVNLWITAIFSGIRIELVQLVFMRIRKSPVKDIINAMITSHKGGVPVELIELEAHALAGGDVTIVVKSMIKAKNEGIETSFKEISSVDLAGNNVTDFLSRKKNQLQSYDIRTDLCRKIMNEFNEGQVKELDRYISKFD